ncbi:hypothetical protein [Streptomyces sp. IB2014 016-6]|uniref:hypothetical protein n=1 Tax=Streptomyces sp. IB2014 016-6 TaxID=2517818 RepID=UPI0011CB9C65|nr:hypothetical protein [Streptomyces sp. IB2014 016-6]TXL83762.1 hypothetical protein EW053_36700 [Streptomyces sp. IB2014 016-6]
MPQDRTPTDPRRAAMERAAQEAQQQQQQQQATDMVNAMHTALAAGSSYYLTTEELQQGLDANRAREAHVNDHAARLDVGTYSNTERMLALASEQALNNYRASHNAYGQSENHENYNQMLRDGTAYVALQRQMQETLENRLDTLEFRARNYDPVRDSGQSQDTAQDYGSVAQAARGTLPHGSRNASQEQPTSRQSANRSTSQSSGSKRQKPSRG